MYERFVNNVVDFVINPAEIKYGREWVIAQTILARIKRTERIFSLSNKSRRDMVNDFVVCHEHVFFVPQGISGVISQECMLCIKSGSMVLRIGPTRGWGGLYPLYWSQAGCFGCAEGRVLVFAEEVPNCFVPAGKITAGTLGEGAYRFIYARRFFA